MTTMKYRLATEVGLEPWLYPMDVLDEALEFFILKRASRLWTKSDEKDLEAIQTEVRERIR